MISHPLHILIVFLGIIAGALILVGRFEIARKISPVLIILFVSALLANTGLLPTQHDFYGGLSGVAVPFAVCLILLGVRFSEIKKTGLPILKAFGAASVGSMAGCLIAGILLSGRLDEILAGQGWKLAGPYIGTYIGGSLNFFSMWEGLKIDNPDLFAAANAVDNLTLMPIFMFWIIAPQWLMKWYPETAIEPQADVQPEAQSATPLKLTDLVILTFIGLGVMAAAGLIKTHLFASWFPQIPTILIVTTLALLLGQFRTIQKLQGGKELGNFAFYLFFAAIGAMMDIPKAIKLAPVLFIYVAIVIVSQIAVVLILGKLMRLDLKLLAVASIAAKAGPSSVVAYTSAKSWNHLALPGVAAGLLGYAIGNYAAFAGVHLLRILLN